MAPHDDEQPAPAGVETPKPPEPRRRRRRRVTQVSLYALALLTAILAALVVTLFTVDMGPYVKEEAEKRATTHLDRRMTIGRVSAKLTPGKFELHDVVIEGMTPQARPFLKARLLTVSLPWWTIR